MKTFPKPLSIQEEREYLKRYKEGDLEAREVLINRNLRLVAHVIKKYQQTGYHRTHKGCKYLQCGERIAACHICGEMCGE